MNHLPSCGGEEARLLPHSIDAIGTELDFGEKLGSEESEDGGVGGERVYGLKRCGGE